MYHIGKTVDLQGFLLNRSKILFVYRLAMCCSGLWYFFLWRVDFLLISQHTPTLETQAVFYTKVGVLVVGYISTAGGYEYSSLLVMLS